LRQKIIFLSGIPGSGKSTFSKSIIEKEVGKWKRINNDSLRESFDFYLSLGKDGELIGFVRRSLIKEFLRRGYNLIIDNSNIWNSGSLWNEVVLIAELLNLNVDIEEVRLYCPLEEAIERDSKRSGFARVGEKVIKEFWEKSGKENFKNYTPKKQSINKIDKILQNKDLEKAAIFDLDGTLCNISHRNPYNTSLCLDDKPNDYVLYLCKKFHKDSKIFFFSGRSEEYRDLTNKWLEKHFSTDYSLHMRKKNDKRKDFIVKKELFNEVIKDKYNVIAVVDDRLEVCELWHNLGLPLFRVGDPNANF